MKSRGNLELRGLEDTHESAQNHIILPLPKDNFVEGRKVVFERCLSMVYGERNARRSLLNNDFRLARTYSESLQPIGSIILVDTAITIYPTMPFFCQ